ADRLEHAHALGDDLAADAVAGDDCDLVFLHVRSFPGSEILATTMRSMRFAAIETSSDWCSAALWIDGEIASMERRAPNRHSELVLPMLFELLAETKIKVENLEGIAFGAGPGS